MYRDYNNPKERKALKEALTRTICNAEQKEQEDLNRSFTWDDMKQIEAVIERQEEIIEEQEKKIEDQEERIAIMTEGKLTLDDFHDFLWDNYFVLKICEESMAFLNKWILAYKEHVKVEHELPKEGETE